MFYCVQTPNHLLFVVGSYISHNSRTPHFARKGKKCEKLENLFHFWLQENQLNADLGFFFFPLLNFGVWVDSSFPVFLFSCCSQLF